MPGIHGPTYQCDCGSVGASKNGRTIRTTLGTNILLMVQKSQTTTWHVWNPGNNGKLTISTGAGFLPLVSPPSRHFWVDDFPFPVWWDMLVSWEGFPPSRSNHTPWNMPKKAPLATGILGETPLILTYKLLSLVDVWYIWSNKRSKVSGKFLQDFWFRSTEALRKVKLKVNFQPYWQFFKHLFSELILLQFLPRNSI